MTSTEEKVIQPTKLKVRDSIFINVTRSICPECKITIDAEILVRENKVYMKKRCPVHGWFEALIFSDYEMYRDFERYNKPGDIPLEFQTEVIEGCPSDCGLCPSHKQHTCLAIIEITEMCNMKCPTCFASSAPVKGLHHKDIETINGMIRTLERSEGEPAVVMLSGGEPTVHPDFLEIIQNITNSKVKKIILNSNGLKFAASREFVKKINEINSDITVYLQFDGFDPKTNKLIRGEDGLLDKKMKAIEHLKEFDIGINLVMTVIKGVNDHEIGDVVNFTHETEGITGVSFQPFFAEGRFDNYDPMDHTTMPDVIHAISAQTDNMYVKDDFYPIPCPYPHCSAVTFSYKDPVSNDFVTISRLVDVEDYLDYFRNTVFPELDNDVLESLESIFSFSSISGSHEMLEGFCNACGIEFNFDDISKSLGHYLKNVKMITIKPFMNSWDFDVRRIMKCCVHEVTEDNKLIPFCAYNTIYRKNYESSSMKVFLNVIN
ncbi:MAG: radical SAM protein [Candidatus Heimdallarchaeota archaeon]|nr:radical SAM protein [Candidatus Heimdallarchaeota archaeon]